MAQRTLCGYGGTLAPEHGELDTLANFDDRSLATLVGTNVAHLDDETATILRSLERWGDRGGPR